MSLNHSEALKALERCSQAIGPFWRDDDIACIKHDIATACPEEWDTICENTTSAEARTEMIRAYLAVRPSH